MALFFQGKKEAWEESEKKDAVVAMTHQAEGKIMVLVLDGNYDIGAQVLIEIGNSICLRHLSRSRAVAKYSNNTCFLRTCAVVFLVTILHKYLSSDIHIDWIF